MEYAVRRFLKFCAVIAVLILVFLMGMGAVLRSERCAARGGILIKGAGGEICIDKNTVIEEKPR